MTATRASQAIECLPTVDALMTAAAGRFVAAAQAAVASTGRFVVALPGGSTPRRLFALLATEPHAGCVDWSRTHVFFGDERCVGPDDPESNYRLARETLLEPVHVPAANVHRMRGEDEPAGAAAAYELDLRSIFATPDGPPVLAPGRRFDLVLLGMGSNGHTASLFPGLGAVREQERWVVAEHVAEVSMWRLTLTPRVLNAAADVLFLVAGADKAAMLQRVLEGPADPVNLPAQAVHPTHGTLTWLVDRAAGTQLHGGTPA